MSEHSRDYYGIYTVGDSEGRNIGICAEQFVQYQAAEPLAQELLVRRWRREGRPR